MIRALEHFKTITYHRYLVAKGCFAVGLYYQGLTHDLSKYSPAEFIVGAMYYQGNRSPNNAEREDRGYSSAWLHHKGRNKHHYEYWIDYSVHAIDKGFTPVPMPRRYVVEMFMDRVAASKVYNGDAYKDSDPLTYFSKGKGSGLLHPKTEAQLERLLMMLARYGEKKTFAYIKNHVLKTASPAQRIRAFLLRQRILADNGKLKKEAQREAQREADKMK